jgi:hypothetical protein
MATQIVRRLYIYVAAFIGLQMFAGGATQLLTLLGERLLGGAPVAAPEFTALRLSAGVALFAVGALLWGGHWALAERDARQPDGQRSALRRLYAYAVLLVAAIGALFALNEALSVALGGRGQGGASLQLLSPLVSATISGVVWLAHWRRFGADRAEVEAAGPNATLRRWYLALTLWVSLAMAVFGAGVLIHSLLQRFAFTAPGTAQQLAMPAAALISGALLWLPHELWSRRLLRRPGPLQAGEQGATLRQVYTALVITSSLVAALAGLVALLAAGLRVALAAATWAGAFAEETRAAAALAVALPLLFYHREQLLATARLSGAAGRVETARRLITYLLGAVGLATLYTGIGGLAGTLLRLWLSPEVVGGAWATPLSWYTAATIVALPVFWLAARSAEGRARAGAEEQRALSRRIYLYAGLLFGVIASVASATPLIQLLVVSGLGQSEPGAAGEIGRQAAYAALGAAIATGYGVLLGRAGRARGTAGAGWSIVLVAAAPLRQALEAAVAHELPGAAVAPFDEQDSPERRAALAGADALVLSLAAQSDGTLARFQGPRLLLATPLEGATLIGARREGPGLAREAARALRDLCGGPPPLHQPPPAGALAPGPI